MRACSVIKAVFFRINNYIVLASSSRTKTADALSSRSFTFIFFLFFFFTSSSSHTEAALLLTLFVPLQLTRHDGLSVFVVVNKVVFSSSFSRGVSPRLYGGWRMPTHATRRHHRTPAGKKTQSSIPWRWRVTRRPNRLWRSSCPRSARRLQKGRWHKKVPEVETPKPSSVKPPLPRRSIGGYTRLYPKCRCKIGR